MSATTKEQPTPQTTPTKDPVDKKKVKLFVVNRKGPRARTKRKTEPVVITYFFFVSLLFHVLTFALDNQHFQETKVTDEEPLSKSTEDNDDSKVVNIDDLIDMNTFDQLLDMDDEDDHEFSYSIVQDYFKQAEVTFEDMDAAL